MYEPSERVIDVDLKWYVELMKYLRPEERWHDSANGGKVLFVMDYSDGGSRKLIFRPHKSEQ